MDIHTCMHRHIYLRVTYWMLVALANCMNMIVHWAAMTPVLKEPTCRDVDNLNKARDFSNLVMWTHIIWEYSLKSSGWDLIPILLNQVLLKVWLEDLHLNRVPGVDQGENHCNVINSVEEFTRVAANQFGLQISEVNLEEVVPKLGTQGEKELHIKK